MAYSDGTVKEEFSLCIPATSKKRVVVVGGGFGGMNLVKHLDAGLFQVVLFDKNNYHTFMPLLYQVATAGIEPDTIADPLRNLVESGKDIHFRMAKVLQIDTVAQTINTIIGNLRYDYLVIATGTKTNFFGNESIQKCGLPLKSLRNALNMRSKFLESLERATITTDRQERSYLLNFVIVGGGPTGVELAGTLAEMRKFILPRDYPELDIMNMQIYLVHSHERLLPYMSEKAGRKTHKFLEEMGVNLVLGKKVTHYDGETATLSTGEEIKAKTLVWSAGVQGDTIPGLKPESMERGMYVTDPFTRIKGYDTIFAIGDVASLKTEKYPEGYPGVAQVALQQGKQLGRNLNRLARKEEMEPFHYRNKGTIATIGRNKAVADLAGNIRTGGWFAWFSWWVVHIYYLVGFRNKLGAFANWILNYFAYKYSSRLIIRPFEQEDNEEDVQLVPEGKINETVTEKTSSGNL